MSTHHLSSAEPLIGRVLRESGPTKVMKNIGKRSILTTSRRCFCGSPKQLLHVPARPPPSGRPQIWPRFRSVAGPPWSLRPVQSFHMLCSEMPHRCSEMPHALFGTPEDRPGVPGDGARTLSRRSWNLPVGPTLLRDALRSACKRHGNSRLFSTESRKTE